MGLPEHLRIATSLDPKTEAQPLFFSERARANREIWTHDDDARPRYVIVHAMGEFLQTSPMRSAQDFFANGDEVAHSLVSPSGLIIRLLPTDRVGWHCRAEGMNWRALGIEFLVPGCHSWTSFVRAMKNEQWENYEQLHAGANEIAFWCRKFDIPIEHILRHSDVDPRNKSDPGERFRWEDLIELVRERLR